MSVKKSTKKTVRKVIPATLASPVLHHADLRDVTLVFKARDARCVTVAGSFNDWDTQAHPLMYIADATFQTTLHLPPGEYRYKFVVDGHWMEDPVAATHERNAHGTLDSILYV